MQMIYTKEELDRVEDSLEGIKDFIEQAKLPYRIVINEVPNGTTTRFAMYNDLDDKISIFYSLKALMDDVMELIEEEYEQIITFQKISPVSIEEIEDIEEIEIVDTEEFQDSIVLSEDVNDILDEVLPEETELIEDVEEVEFY